MKTVNESVIKAFARVTTEARAGNIGAVAIVTVSPNGQPEISFAGESDLVPHLNFGVDMLKATLVSQVCDHKPVAASGLVVPANGLQS